MNKAQQLTEAIEKLLEYNPFGPMGFNIKKHIYLSPDDKKKLLKKRKRVGEKVVTNIPKDRKRIVSVYKHEDEHFGNVHHKTNDNHDIDSNWYSLEKHTEKKNDK